MDHTDLLRRISRPATTFTTGGFRPLHTLTEPWIGRVFAYAPNEGLPLDEDGLPMLPLAQFYLPDLPFVPDELAGTALLTAFVSRQLPKPREPMGARWLIREYASLDDVEHRDVLHPEPRFKAFPLRPRLVPGDCPLWDGGGLDRASEDEILDLERSRVIDSYYDIAEHTYDHKLGGYPSFCQSGILEDGEYVEGFGEGFEFVFQISSDEKAGIHIVDSGSLMFAKNEERGAWSMYYDFY